jgi:hypothetical protein
MSGEAGMDAFMLAAVESNQINLETTAIAMRKQALLKGAAFRPYI